MLPIPQYPWYTYTAITLLWLVALGGLWAILRLYVRLFTRALFMIPRLLDLGWLRSLACPSRVPAWRTGHCRVR